MTDPADFARPPPVGRGEEADPEASRGPGPEADDNPDALREDPVKFALRDSGAVLYGAPDRVDVPSDVESDPDVADRLMMAAADRQAAKRVRTAEPVEPAKKGATSPPVSLRSIIQSLLFSKWIAAALGLLFLSNVLFICAFVTNGWGKLTVVGPGGQTNSTLLPGDTNGSSSIVGPFTSSPGRSDTGHQLYWEFGLWQCCRSKDNVCIGTRWPGKLY